MGEIRRRWQSYLDSRETETFGVKFCLSYNTCYQTHSCRSGVHIWVCVRRLEVSRTVDLANLQAREVQPVNDPSVDGMHLFAQLVVVLRYLRHTGELLVAQGPALVCQWDAASLAEGLGQDPVVEDVPADLVFFSSQYDLLGGGFDPDVTVLHMGQFMLCACAV